VAKLVAKLSSVSRDDPERALRMIDTILRAESKSSSTGQGSRAGSRAEVTSNSPILPIKEDAVAVTGAGDDDEEDDDDQDEESESSETSCDDTSVSSITNPTYQRDDKAYDHTKVASTSNSRNPRPTSLNKYTQMHPTSQDDSRGKSNKAKKEKKPPPPATIKVNKNDSSGSNAAGRKSSSKKDKKGRKESAARKVRALSPARFDRMQLPGNAPMDAAAIAMKIRGWDEQLSNRDSGLDSAPLSPNTNRTEDTAKTEDLGSIITPQSQKPTVTESRRSHPWDDTRPQSGKKFGAIDLTIGAGADFEDFGNDEVDNFGFVSPWQKRRAAKRDTDSPENPASSGERANANVTSANREETRGRARQAGSRSPGESPRIAPNVYDVHRNRRSRSRDKGSCPEPSRERDPPSNTKSDSGNPFDSAYKSRPSSTKSDKGKPFESAYRERPKSTKSDTGKSFDSDHGKPRSTSKSDTGDIFDSAWVALPADAFPGQPTTPGRARSDKLPDAVSSAFAADMDLLDTSTDLPPRTPTNRAPFGKEDLPEASRDPNESGGRLRRGFLKMRRSNTPKKERPSPQSNGSKPLLSAYAMDSVVDVKDEFKVRQKPSRSPGRRSRTLSPAPRSVMKSKSPGRNRLRRRNGSFTDGEDETSSLTGSLTGSTASSVRNKNLAKKFSRFLKVYED